VIQDLTHREIIAFGLGGLVALAAFNTGVAQARMVPSGSMEPTFAVGDRLMVVPAKPDRLAVRRGDVLVFKPPFERTYEAGMSWAQGLMTLADDQPYIKRAIGLPGEEIRIRKGVGVFVNGQLLDEPYIRVAPQYEFGPTVVPAGHLFMLGDNRNHSFDSHYWGFLPVKNVTGRPAAVIWPPTRWQRF
jgi:signal peptidase I